MATPCPRCPGAPPACGTAARVQIVAMKALVFDGHELRYRGDLRRPVPRRGEARIRVTLAGVCGTDRELLRGYHGFHGIPGHEFVGVVETAPGHAGWVGRRVVGEITIACGRCVRCRADQRGHCARRRVLGILGKDGVFAEFATLPVANLHTVPDAVPDEDAVFAEPLAAACELLEQVPVKRRQRIVVLGDGPLGILCAQVLRVAGGDPLLLGRHPGKLRVATACGVRCAAWAAGTPPPVTDADLVVECTGRAAGFAAAQTLVRPRGTIVLKSTVAGTVATDLAALVVNEITVIGSRCGPFPRALELLAARRVQVRPLIARAVPLAELPAVLVAPPAPDELKVLVRP